MCIIANGGGNWLEFVLGMCVFFGFIRLLHRYVDRRERLEREANERKWNSPEEVERRRIQAEQDAERQRVEAAAEAERQRIAEINEAKRASDKWERYHKFMRTEEINGMTGVEFERFTKTLFAKIGYKEIRETPTSGDHGADLICKAPDNRLTVVQTKRWRGSVGNSAIQEVLGALLYYDAKSAIVVTNSRFTDSAKSLARKDDRITLMNGEALHQLVREHFPREVPPFNQQDYDRDVKYWNG